jgi:hypothetical protein
VLVGAGTVLVLLALGEGWRTAQAHETHEELLLAWGATRECLLGGPLGPKGTIAGRISEIEAGQPRVASGASVPRPAPGTASAPPSAEVDPAMGEETGSLGADGWPTDCSQLVLPMETLIEREIWLTLPSTRASALRRLLQQLSSLELGLVPRGARHSPAPPANQAAELAAVLERVVAAANEAGLQRAPVPTATATQPRRSWLLPRFPFPLPRAVLVSGRLHDAVATGAPTAPAPPSARFSPVTLAAAVAPLGDGTNGPILHVYLFRDERPFHQGITVWTGLDLVPTPGSAPPLSLLLTDDAHGGTTITDVALLSAPRSAAGEIVNERGSGKRLVLYRADGGVSLIDFDPAGNATVRWHD